MGGKLKVLIGTSDIAGLINQYALGFKEAGYQVTTTSIYPFANLFAHNYDVKLYELGALYFTGTSVWSRFCARSLSILFNRMPALKTRIIQRRLINHHDIFIYIWGKSSLLPGKRDFPIIRDQNKKIVHFFLGTDARVAEAFKQEFHVQLKSYYDTPTPLDEFQEKISQIRTIEKYAHLIYSIPDQSGLQIRPFNHLVLPINYKAIDFKEQRSGKITVIHCPSNQAIKGTEFIVETIEKLKQELDFEFKLVSGVSNKEIIKTLQQGHILVDEIVLHGPGMLSLEAMSSGCVVLTRVAENNVQRFDPPVVHVTEKNLYDKLKKVILNERLRARILKKGRKWVEENHSATAIAKKIIADLQLAPSLTYDYYPSFYKQFELPSYLHYSTENLRLTEEVLRSLPNGAGQ